MNDAGRTATAGRALRSTCVAFVLCSLGAHAVAAIEPGARGGAYIALHLVLGGLMLTAAGFSRHAARDDMRWVVGAGMLAAVLMLPVTHFTTHDVQRYLWDGRVLLEGLDPYRIAPNDAAVAWLRAIWPTPPEHVAYPTLYPPGALLAFAAAALFGASLGIWVWKLMLTAALLGVIALCARLARQLGVERHLAWVALNPLLLLEVGVGVHLDVLSALAVVAALVQWQHRRFAWVGVLLGIGALIKLTPVLALVPLVVAVPRWRDGARVAGGAAATVGAGYGLALLGGLVPWGSTGAFFAGWSFGSPLGRLLAVAAGKDALLVGAVLGGLGLLVAAIWARRGAPLPAVALALALPMLLSPVSFPWYLLVLVPLLLVAPSPPLIGWMLAAPLTYEVLDSFDRDGTWVPAAWPLVLIVLAWGLGALVLLRSRLLRRRQLA